MFSGTPDENLECFLENFESLLQSKCVSFRLWCPYLKQQIQNHQRAFDSVILAEKDHINLLGGDSSKASEFEYAKFYDAIKQDLLSKCGKTKQEHIRELLEQYYSMHQRPSETVAEFSHLLLNVQHELPKHIPNTHLTKEVSDIELQYALLIKQRCEIKLNS